MGIILENTGSRSGFLRSHVTGSPTGDDLFLKALLVVPQFVDDVGQSFFLLQTMSNGNTTRSKADTIT